jgi:hypothetical protein
LPSWLAGTDYKEATPQPPKRTKRS